MSHPLSDEADLPNWPFDWPGRELVDLDNVGDPSAWLQEQISDPRELLTHGPEADQQTAEELSSAYVTRLDDIGFDLGIDSDFTEEELMTALAFEFAGFLREWRRLAAKKNS